MMIYGEQVSDWLGSPIIVWDYGIYGTILLEWGNSKIVSSKDKSQILTNRQKSYITYITEKMQIESCRELSKINSYILNNQIEE